MGSADSGRPLKKMINEVTRFLSSIHTCTVSWVKSELINSKPSIASLPLEHQPEVLVHVDSHLACWPLGAGSVKLRSRQIPQLGPIYMTLGNCFDKQLTEGLSFSSSFSSSNSFALTVCLERVPVKNCLLLALILIYPKTGGVPCSKGCKPEWETHLAVLAGRDGGGDHLHSVGADHRKDEKSLDNDRAKLPTASVEDIKVSIAHGCSVCLVRKVSRSLSEGGHAPVKVICSGSVSPATSISVKAALSLDHHGWLGHCLAHSVIECDVIHSYVSTSAVVTPNTLNNNLKTLLYSLG